MRTKNTNKDNNLKKERDQFTVVLERIDSKIDLLVESHQSLRESHDALRESHDALRESHETLRDSHEILAEEMHKGFQMTFEHISRVENEIVGELAAKADAKEISKLKRRVDKLEKAMWRDD